MPGVNLWVYLGVDLRGDLWGKPRVYLGVYLWVEAYIWVTMEVDLWVYLRVFLRVYSGG